MALELRQPWSSQPSEAMISHAHTRLLWEPHHTAHAASHGGSNATGQTHLRGLAGEGGALTIGAMAEALQDAVSHACHQPGDAGEDVASEASRRTQTQSVPSPRPSPAPEERQGADGHQTPSLPPTPSPQPTSHDSSGGLVTLCEAAFQRWELMCGWLMTPDEDGVQRLKGSYAACDACMGALMAVEEVRAPPALTDAAAGDVLGGGVAMGVAGVSEAAARDCLWLPIEFDLAPVVAEAADASPPPPMPPHPPAAPLPPPKPRLRSMLQLLQAEAHIVHSPPGPPPTVGQMMAESRRRYVHACSVAPSPASEEAAATLSPLPSPSPRSSLRPAPAPGGNTTDPPPPPPPPHREPAAAVDMESVCHEMLEKVLRFCGGGAHAPRDSWWRHPPVCQECRESIAALRLTDWLHRRTRLHAKHAKHAVSLYTAEDAEEEVAQQRRQKEAPTPTPVPSGVCMRVMLKPALLSSGATALAAPPPAPLRRATDAPPPAPLAPPPTQSALRGGLLGQGLGPHAVLRGSSSLEAAATRLLGVSSTSTDDDPTGWPAGEAKMPTAADQRATQRLFIEGLLPAKLPVGVAAGASALDKHAHPTALTIGAVVVGIEEAVEEACTAPPSPPPSPRPTTPPSEAQRQRDAACVARAREVMDVCGRADGGGFPLEGEGWWRHQHKCNQCYEAIDAFGGGASTASATDRRRATAPAANASLASDDGNSGGEEGDEGGCLSVPINAEGLTTKAEDSEHAHAAAEFRGDSTTIGAILQATRGAVEAECIPPDGSLASVLDATCHAAFEEVEQACGRWNTGNETARDGWWKAPERCHRCYAALGALRRVEAPDSLDWRVHPGEHAASASAVGGRDVGLLQPNPFVDEASHLRWLQPSPAPTPLRSSHHNGHHDSEPHHSHPGQHHQMSHEHAEHRDRVTYRSPPDLPTEYACYHVPYRPRTPPSPPPPPPAKSATATASSASRSRLALFTSIPTTATSGHAEASASMESDGEASLGARGDGHTLGWMAELIFSAVQLACLPPFRIDPGFHPTTTASSSSSATNDAAMPPSPPPPHDVLDEGVPAALDARCHAAMGEVERLCGGSAPDANRTGWWRHQEVCGACLDAARAVGAIAPMSSGAMASEAVTTDQDYRIHPGGGMSAARQTRAGSRAATAAASALLSEDDGACHRVQYKPLFNDAFVGSRIRTPAMDRARLSLFVAPGRAPAESATEGIAAGRLLSAVELSPTTVGALADDVFDAVSVACTPPGSSGADDAANAAAHAHGHGEASPSEESAVEADQRWGGDSAVMTPSGDTRTMETTPPPPPPPAFSPPQFSKVLVAMCGARYEAVEAACAWMEGAAAVAAVRVGLSGSGARGGGSVQQRCTECDVALAALETEARCHAVPIAFDAPPAEVERQNEASPPPPPHPLLYSPSLPPPPSPPRATPRLPTGSLPLLSDATIASMTFAELRAAILERGLSTECDGPAPSRKGGKGEL